VICLPLDGCGNLTGSAAALYSGLGLPALLTREIGPELFRAACRMGREGHASINADASKNGSCG
jgi:hypothetical protein